MMTHPEPRSPLLVLCGPTAVGKTESALAAARQYHGEIVNADSRQVYRQMDIGTAKPTLAQRAVVPHHLFNCVEPDQPFTLADYLDAARPCIAGIVARGHLPIIVGGTGLYIRALVQGYDVPRVEPQPQLRAELEQLASSKGAGALLERLRELDPQRAGSIDAANPRRLIRAIEVAMSQQESGEVPSSSATEPPYRALVLGLTMERQALYQQADRRMELMIASGFCEEVAALRERGYSSDLPALSSLGYRELYAYLEGTLTLDEAMAATRSATHRFIRRQYTWFRREPGLIWLHHGTVPLAEQVMDAVLLWQEAPA